MRQNLVYGLIILISVVIIGTAIAGSGTISTEVDNSTVNSVQCPGYQSAGAEGSVFDCGNCSISTNNENANVNCCAVPVAE